MPTVVRIRGWEFALVNLPVVLVYGYGRGSCHLDFCRHVDLPDRRSVMGVGSPSLCGVSSFLPEW